VVDTIDLNDCHGVVVNAENKIGIARNGNYPESIANLVGNYNMHES
jgi:hypothetical protein